MPAIQNGTVTLLMMFVDFRAKAVIDGILDRRRERLNLLGKQRRLNLSEFNLESVLGQMSGRSVKAEYIWDNHSISYSIYRKCFNPKIDRSIVSS